MLQKIKNRSSWETMYFVLSWHFCFVTFSEEMLWVCITQGGIQVPAGTRCTWWYRARWLPIRVRLLHSKLAFIAASISSLSPYLITLTIALWLLQKVSVKSHILSTEPQYVSRSCSKSCIDSVSLVGGASVYCCTEDGCNSGSSNMASTYILLLSTIAVYTARQLL